MGLQSNKLFARIPTVVDGVGFFWYSALKADLHVGF